MATKQQKSTSSQSVPARRSTSGQTMWSAPPFGLLRRFANEIDDLFGDFSLSRSPLWERAGFLTSPIEAGWPQIDMFESEGQFVVRADLPGLKKDDLDVQVTDNELIISGERKDEREEKKGNVFHSERSYGSFERRISLPEGTNPDDVSCTFNNGILEIRMKASEPATKGRRLEIQEKGSSGSPEKAA
jgi:HSP20 family protein